jgi:uncharacterized NAD(P)/FAD-binding protein YdhS
VHGRLRAEFSEGRAHLLRGLVVEVTRDGERFKLKLKRRASEEPETIRADLAFDCSGFKPDLDQALIASLFAWGLARPDPHRLGLVVKRNGEVMGDGGRPTEGLFAVGPLCQGTLWEITAVPEIVAQADLAAESVAALSEAGTERRAASA